MIDIVIVNWNAGDYLRECLASIPTAAEGVDLRRVIVVDNASTDGSADGLGGLPLPLTVIRNRENRGFAAACNQGAAASDARYVLFLNPDTVLRHNSLTVPLAFMEKPDNQRFGICGIQLVDDSGIARSCSRFPSVRGFFAKAVGGRGPTMTEWDHRTTREVDQVIGAFFLVRRSLFAQLGGFDERFFVYFEEVDFALRARQAGAPSIYLADARAYHKGGGTTDQIKARRLFYSLQSRILYGLKHFRGPRAAALLVVTLLVEPVSRVALALVKRRGARETVEGYGMLLTRLPSLRRPTP